MGLRDHIPIRKGSKAASRIGDAGRSSEKRVGKSLGARMRPASGAMDGVKGDMQLGSFLIECKSTTANSMNLQYSWLGKISQEALTEGRTPALTVSFTDARGRAVNFGEWVMIPLSTFKTLMGDD